MEAFIFLKLVYDVYLYPIRVGRLGDLHPGQIRNGFSGIYSRREGMLLRIW